MLSAIKFATQVTNRITNMTRLKKKHRMSFEQI